MGKDYIIINYHGNPVRFKSGDIIIYGNYDEAADDLYKTDIGLATIAYSKNEYGTQVATLYAPITNNLIGSFTYSDEKNDFQTKLKDFVKVNKFC